MSFKQFTVDTNKSIELNKFILKLLKRLSNKKRLDVFSNFCLRCGSDNPKCQCWNDE
jgi:hypothetical protein